MEKVKDLVLRSRHTLLITAVVTFIVLVVIEGIVMDRDSRIFTLDNRYFEFNVTNIEEFEARRNRDR